MKVEKMKEKEAMKLEEEEKGSIEEVVMLGEEGELLLVKRVLFGLQRIAGEPNQDPFHPKKRKPLSLPS